MDDFILILRNDSSLQSIIRLYNVTMTPNELLSYGNNAFFVYERYTQKQKSEYITANSEVINKGTLIRIPRSRLRRTVVESGTNKSVFKNNPFKAFFGDEIKRIIGNPNYKQLPLKNISNGSLLKQFPEITVFVWCRAWGQEYLEGRLINVTPFIMNLTTNNSINGGNFSITLPSALGFFDEGWQIKPNTQFEYTNNFLNKSNLSYLYEDKFIESENLFQLTISSNDIVFIQFETLQMERNIRKNNNNNFFVDFSELEGRVFDMIGMVDSVNKSNNYTDNLGFVSLVGRDLNKILIDDGCYFYPLQYTSEKGIFVNGTGNDSGADRIFGNLYELNAYIDRSISFSLQFIFEKLSNILLCEDSLFSFVKNFKVNNSLKINKNGIWKGIEIIIDPEIENRNIVDSSIAEQMGSLMNYVNKVCQKPFVEFFSDTYGDRFYFIVRKPPTNYESYLSLLDNAIDVYSDDLYSFELDYNSNEVYSWYKLTPQGAFLGNGTQFALAYLPAIYFAEYAQIWGSRPLEVVTNYIDYRVLSQENNIQNNQDSYNEQQSYEDLKYLIESNAYNPFVRQGSLVLNGDRRIKKGQAIRLHHTGEVFQVESVQQVYSINEGIIDRQTIVEVKRGMVEVHFEKYFKIILFDERQVSKPKNPPNITKQTFILDVHFDSNKDYIITLDDPEINQETKTLQRRFPKQRKELRERSLQSISRLADLLLENPEMKMLIKGHTDSQGGFDFNIDLSNRRANRISTMVEQECITRSGISVKERITTQGLGESQLLISENNEKSRSLNRRVEVEIENTTPSAGAEFIKTKEINWHVNRDYFHFFLKREQWLNKANSKRKGGFINNEFGNLA